MAEADAKSTYQKPLPTVRPESEAFWAGTREGKFLLQNCRECGITFFYPRPACPSCLSGDLQWIESSGKGTVWTYSVHFRGPTPAYKGEPPHVVALVELEEGPKCMTNVINIDPGEVKIGMPVEVVFDAVTDEITLPKFQPRA